MQSFLQKHIDKISGALFCPDRLIFKGYSTLSYALGMEGFLQNGGVLLKNFKDFGPEQAQRLKKHAEGMA